MGAGPAWMRHPDTARWARQLHWARNEASHSPKSADLIGPASKASEAAWKILREARHDRANEASAFYRRATMADAKDLRQRLITRAKSGEIIGYHEAAEALGLDFDDKLLRRLFVDALNDTADENERKREPLLCALVVDLESGLPTVGFWRRLGLTGKTPLSERRAAHATALIKVHKYAWR